MASQTLDLQQALNTFRLSGNFDAQKKAIKSRTDKGKSKNKQKPIYGELIEQFD